MGAGIARANSSTTRPTTTERDRSTDLKCPRHPTGGMGSERPPADIEDAVMRATFRALCAHGYADLSMRNIADEFEKSKSLLYYHYDTKEQLMLAFLDHVIGWVPARLEESESEGAAARLVEFLQRFVVQPTEEDRAGFALALFELRLQAAHNEAFRTKLRAHYQENEAKVASIIEEGIEEDVFREVDARSTAQWMYGAIEGARMKQVVLGVDEASEATVDSLLRYLDRHLTTRSTSLPIDGRQVQEAE